MNSGPQVLLRYTRPYRVMLAASLVLANVVGALEAASPFLIGMVFDSIFGRSDVPSLQLPGIEPLLQTLGATFASTGDPAFVLLGLLIAVTILKVLAEYAAVATTTALGQGVVRDLRDDVFRRIVHQPLGFFHRNPTGELISRVSADVERIQAATSETLAELLRQGATLIFLLAAIFIIDWRLSLASLALAPVVIFPARRLGRKLRALGQRGQAEMAKMATILHETFAGNRIVKAFTMEPLEIEKFRAQTQTIFRVNLRQKLTHALSSPLMEVLGVFVIAGFLLYARTAIANGRMTAGLFLAFVIALVKLYDPVRRISGIYSSFQQAFGAGGRVFEILEMPTESNTAGRTLTGLSQQIEFQSVGFEYDREAGAVLTDVSFKVAPGDVLAIVGASGAGKSTLVNLLPRFYDAQRGKILIDGLDIREYSLQSLRKQMALVTQDVILFNDTIQNNVRYGDPSATGDTVRRAARAALVDDFVRDLPNGYDTQIGERGLRLSGGERQRISIARAILKNAPILILDEATSSLDAESEALVQQALQNLMEGRTTIVIAHRLSTIRRANRILVLSEGRVAEIGTHEDLIIRRGLYWKLYNLQFQDVIS